MNCGSHLALDVALAQLVGGERGGGGGTHAEAVACRAWGRLAGRGAQHVVTLKSKPTLHQYNIFFSTTMYRISKINASQEMERS